jgi:hypothetical protein
MRRILLSLIAAFLLTAGAANAQTTKPAQKKADAQTAKPKDQNPETKTTEVENDKRPENTNVSEVKPASLGEPTPESGEGKRWSFYLTMFGLFDTNINQDEEDVTDYGLVAGAGIYFRNRSKNPNFEFNYEIGRHTYKNTDRWDRTSHNLRAWSENRLGKRWVSTTSGEISIKGSTEDRELANRYSLSQFFQYRLTPNHRFNIGGAYRLKRYDDDERRNSTNPYGEIGYERRFTNGKRKLEFSYRYEENRARDVNRNSYIRWTYGAKFRTPLSKGGRLDIEARYRPQKYARLIRIDIPNAPDLRVPRQDKRWILSAEWHRAIRTNLELGLVYKYEQRNSNDIDRNFKAHAAGVVLTYRWWR